MKRAGGGMRGCAYRQSRWRRRAPLGSSPFSLTGTSGCTTPLEILPFPKAGDLLSLSLSAVLPHCLSFSLLPGVHDLKSHQPLHRFKRVVGSLPLRWSPETPSSCCSGCTAGRSRNYCQP